VEEEEPEEGEIPASPADSEPAAPKTKEQEHAEKKAKKLAEQRAAQEELKARHRMLGNIQFIGHLYR
jgi:translation initiation factor 4G